MFHFFPPLLLSTVAKFGAKSTPFKPCLFIAGVLRQIGLKDENLETAVDLWLCSFTMFLARKAWVQHQNSSPCTSTMPVICSKSLPPPPRGGNRPLHACVPLTRLPSPTAAQPALRWLTVGGGVPLPAAVAESSPRTNPKFGADSPFAVCALLSIPCPGWCFLNPVYNNQK